MLVCTAQEEVQNF
jgi:hypothetical protein